MHVAIHDLQLLVSREANSMHMLLPHTVPCHVCCIISDGICMPRFMQWTHSATEDCMPHACMMATLIVHDDATA